MQHKCCATSFQNVVKLLLGYLMRELDYKSLRDFCSLVRRMIREFRYEFDFSLGANNQHLLEEEIGLTLKVHRS